MHDTSAFEDEKVTELFLNYGYEGVGLFYVFLEKIGKHEKPVKTAVLKSQLKVGKKLEKCWNFMEEIGLISSNNGETFNKQLLNFSEKFQIKSEKNKKRISQWRENQALAENVTRSESVRNAGKEKIITDNIITDNNNDSSFKKEAKSANDFSENAEVPKDLNAEQPKRKKVPRKKENDEPPEIPTMQAFTAYGKMKDPDVSQQALELKYAAWTESGWQTGHGKPIKNWKATLLNTIPYLPKNTNTTNGHQQTTNGITANTKPKTIGGMRSAEVEEFVRRQLQRGAAANGGQEPGIAQTDNDAL